MSNHNVSDSVSEANVILLRCQGVSYHLFSFCVFFGNLNKDSISRFHVFIVFIVSAVNAVPVAIPRPSLWISDFHIFGIKHNAWHTSLAQQKCDKSSLSYSDHKLTQLLIKHPVAVPSTCCIFQKFVDQTQTCQTSYCLRLISAVIDPLDSSS